MRLDLKVGFTCNNLCTFCVQGDKRERITPRALEEMVDILRESRARTSEVVFTGGEPTVHKDLLRAVAAAKALGYRVIQLQTNGRRLCHEPYLEAAVRAGVNQISPSLHGSTPEIHDAVTRAPGAWQQTKRGIEASRRHGLQVITNSVVTRQNLHDLPALARLLVSLDVQQIQFAFVHPEGTALREFEHVVPRFTEARPLLHEALDVVRAAGITAFAEAVPYCFMRGHELQVVERVIPDTRVVDKPITIADYTAYRLDEGKAKGPACARCSFDAVCEGPWREYPDGYGWDEFEPRADDPRVALGLDR
ncbi:MAG: radical SAM protein [Polyangiaceae bacterium]|nr:radical SAM protein [Polyangiaceae bacterium]